MSNPNEASTKIKWRVGMFTLGGILFIGVLSIYINNRPFWWRPCELVQVTIEDATGLKKKSPVKSLGLDIGYISDIGLVGQGVKLVLCITGPVETIEAKTKAYVRGEGFLGDKFLELKPVKYTGSHLMEGDSAETSAPSAIEEKTAPTVTPANSTSGASLLRKIFGFESAYAEGMSVLGSAQAAPQKKSKQVELGEKSVDMQEMMTQLNSVMGEVKGITSSLKESINPEEIRGTIKQLNKTLEEASKTFSPQGGLTQTAQRTLIKLEDTIEQFRDQLTRINQGQGSVGMVLNDPTYAEELKKALINLNKILGRASDMRLSVQLGVIQLNAYNASRGEFQVTIWPRKHRYYMLGLASDPRGTITQDTITTSVGGTETTVQSTKVSQGGFAITAMVGTVFADRFDVAVGVHHGDGAASLGLNLGPADSKEMIQFKNEIYFRGKTVNGAWTAQPDARSYLILQPISIFYLSGGIEGYRKVNGSLSTSFGAGLRFDDEDIKLLFSFL
jgi:phospholipid/cholesterol/gamma-HCH transport system substrate-binding protein